MEKNPFELSESMKKIIHMYQKIYMIVFRYSIFILCVLIASIIACKQSQRVDLEIYEEASEFTIHKISLTKSFDKFIEQQVNNHDIDISVLQGSLQSTGDFLQSNNNLLSYKWYVVPRVFFLYSTVPLMNRDFLTGNYDIKNMKTFAENVVFTPIPEDLYAEPFKRAQLPLYKNLVDSFNISCIFKPKFLQWTCGYYMDNFLQHGFIYDLSNYYDELKNLSNRLKKKWWYHKEFCDTMTKYILYSNDINNDLEPIFRNCGDESLAYFQTLQWFVEIQSQFKSNYSDDYLYSNVNLNIYKLLSLQQIIYNDIRSRKLNDRILFPYFNYVENLLKKNVLDHFYTDFTYRFHNYYIKPRLSNPTFANKKDIVDPILWMINEINNGSKLIGYTWLINQITNKNLLLEKADTSKFLEPVRLSTEELFKNLANLSFLTITNYDIQDNKLSMEWIINIQDKKISHQLKTIFMLEKENNALLLKNIVISDYPTLTEVIQKLLKKNMRSIADLYQYINENYSFYSQESLELKTCDIIKNKVWASYVMKCSDDSIYLQKQISWPPIKYLFTIENYQISKIEISDKKLEAELNLQLSGVVSNKITLPNLVTFIFQYKPNSNEKPKQKTIQETLIIVEKFKKYLWLDPKEIFEEEWSIFVKFQIQWIWFVVEYNKLTHDLWPLYFDNVFYRQGKKLPVKNFSLSLDDEHKTTINNFVVDPLWYIETINENVYKAYLKYK